MNARISLTLLVSFGVAVGTLPAAELSSGSMPMRDRVGLAELIVLATIRSLQPAEPIPERKLSGSVAAIDVREALAGDASLKSAEVFLPDPLAAKVRVGQSWVWLLTRIGGLGALGVPMSDFLLPPGELPAVRAALELAPLHIQLATDKEIYTAPAEIIVTVTLTNRGTQPLVILDPYGPVQEDQTDVATGAKTEHVYLEFSAFKMIEGKPLMLPFGIALTQFPTAGEHPTRSVTLKHGESFTTSANVAKRLGYTVNTAGRVAVRFVYDTTKPHEGVPEHWSGSASSSRVWIVVNERAH